MLREGLPPHVPPIMIKMTQFDINKHSNRITENMPTALNINHFLDHVAQLIIRAYNNKTRIERIHFLVVRYIKGW